MNFNFCFLCQHYKFDRILLLWMYWDKNITSYLYIYIPNIPILVYNSSHVQLLSMILEPILYWWHFNLSALLWCIKNQLMMLCRLCIVFPVKSDSANCISQDWFIWYIESRRMGTLLVLFPVKSNYNRITSLVHLIYNLEELPQRKV